MNWRLYNSLLSLRLPQNLSLGLIQQPIERILFHILELPRGQQQPQILRQIHLFTDALFQFLMKRLRQFTVINLHVVCVNLSPIV